MLMYLLKHVMFFYVQMVLKTHKVFLTETK